MEKDSDKRETVEKTEASSSSEEFNVCSPSNSSSDVSGSPSKNPFVSSSSKNTFSLRSSVLGSSLSTTAAPNSSDSSSKTFVLNPPRLSNPFKNSGEDKEKDADSNYKESSDHRPPTSPKVNSESLSTTTSISSSRVSFVPLGWSSSSGVSASSASAPGSVSSSFTSSFVFGQNLRDRVEGPKSNDSRCDVSSTTSGNHVDNTSEEPKANGTTSEMLFSSAVKSDSGEVKAADSSKSLSEAAREYEEARSVKRKFEPVQLITGEEHEQNVLQMNCKLFAYDKVSSGWQERGRGLLRLNDSPPVSARLIIRAHGSLRVLINTKVFSGMIVERASPKSLRITAMDSSETVKVFLISASQTEVDDLQRHLESRVRKIESADRGTTGGSTCMKKIRTSDDYS